MQRVSEWYQAINIPHTWRVCGVRILALSNWHFFVLESIANRFIVGGQPTRDDCASLLFVCQSKKRDGQPLLWDADATAKAAGRMTRATRKTSLERLESCVTDYIEACTRRPQHRRESSKEGQEAFTYRAPATWHHVLTLCDHYGYSVEDAWNEHYALSRAMHDVFTERDGAKSLVPEDMLVKIESAEERMALARDGDAV